MDTVNLTCEDVNDLAEVCADLIIATLDGSEFINVYGVPRGGIPAAYAVTTQLNNKNRASFVTSELQGADAIVDDIVDSGATRSLFHELHPEIPFFALVENDGPTHCRKWYSFPWERSYNGDDSSRHDIVTRMLEAIGENPKREGLIETPDRVIRAWNTWFSGYGTAARSVLKTFEDGAHNVDQLVLVNNIPVYSHCEHHIAPFFGVAHVAYIPDGRVVGLSKISRLVDVFARRLQIQERLTTQIADALEDALSPKGVGVVLECRHLCMESRGISRQGQTTLTSALRGCVLTEDACRAEFFRLIDMANGKAGVL